MEDFSNGQVCSQVGLAWQRSVAGLIEFGGLPLAEVQKASITAFQTLREVVVNKSYTVFWNGTVRYIRALDAEPIATKSAVHTFLHHDSIDRVVDTTSGDLYFPESVARKVG